MTELTIPSSPSWYLSNILAISDDGVTLAFGARNEVALLNCSPPCTPSSTPHSPIVTIITRAHKERVTALAFSPSSTPTKQQSSSSECEHQDPSTTPAVLANGGGTDELASSASFDNHLVSCADDGAVHVWELASRTLVLTHMGHAEHPSIIGVGWSRADRNIVVSASEDGSIVSWELVNNTIRRYKLRESKSLVCMACCPHDKDLVALGAKGGFVYVYALRGNGSVSFKMRGHENDVVSLAWCPVPYNVLKPDSASRKERTYLLASGAKDRTIYLWKAGSDGRYQCFINLSSTPQSSKGKSGTNLTSIWTTVSWPKPLTILSSSPFGELLAHNLTQYQVDKISDPVTKKLKPKQCRLLHNIHSKGLFSIAAPTRNSQNDKELTVWSFAVDRHLVSCNLLSGEVLHDITTIGGVVYCMAVSPLDHRRVAIGTGDCKLLIWNTSNESCDDIVTHWNKINSKVMAIAWHPKQDSLLAFGTGDGRVGLLDISHSKPPVLLRLYHRRSVYSLIWNLPIVEMRMPPKQNKKTSDLALFSVGDGEILQYNPNFPEEEPASMAPFLNECDDVAVVKKSLGRTDLAWTSDLRLAAIGNENGAVYIVDGKTFSHMHTIFAHKKLVQCITWHPDSVTLENEKSPYATWLASASDNIQIVNITPTGVEVVACLNTHSERVVSLAWSPHYNGRLISASYDYTSQVWDVISASVLACYDGHHGAVVCCLPSSMHQDLIITGSADNTVRMWDINKYSPTKSKQTKKQRIGGVLKKFQGVQEAVDVTISSNGHSAPASIAHPDSSQVAVAHDITVGGVSSSSSSLTSSHKKRPKSMFPVSSTSMGQAKDLNQLWSRINREVIQHEPADASYLHFFGDSKDIRQLVKCEVAHHAKNDNDSFIHNFSLWTGDMSETLKEACRKRQLNDWLLSIAPMVSHKLWVDCCKSYSAQLVTTGDFLKATSYLLAIHQVEEAIDLLMDAKLFREAVVLAKSRVPMGDPTVKRVMLRWAEHCSSTGLIPLTAHCFLSVGCNLEAVEVLSRSKDPAMLTLAADIAYKSSAIEMSISLAMRALLTSLETGEFAKAKNAISNHPMLKDLMIWVEVTSLYNSWKPIDEKHILHWITGNVPKDNKWVGLFQKACELGRFETRLCGGKINYSTLAKFLPNKAMPDSDKKVWVYMAGQISLAVAAYLETNFNSKTVLKHLVSALEAAYNFHVHNPTKPDMLLQIIPWMSPEGPLKVDSSMTSLSETEKSLSESLCAFLASGVVYWLQRLNEVNQMSDVTPAILSDAAESCSRLLFTREILAYHFNEVELKKAEKTLATYKLNSIASVTFCREIEAAQLKGASNGFGDDHSTTNGVATNEEGETKAANLVAQLKSVKSKFEHERLFCPNPFILFCSLKNILHAAVSRFPDSERVQSVLNDLIKMWEAHSTFFSEQ